MERGDHLQDDLRVLKQRYRKLMTLTGRLERLETETGGD